MSYQALYRKWRPQNFEDVKGQEHIVLSLIHIYFIIKNLCDAAHCRVQRLAITAARQHTNSSHSLFASFLLSLFSHSLAKHTSYDK